MNKFFIFDVYTPRYSFEIKEIDSFSEDDWNRLMKFNLLVITNRYGFHQQTVDLKNLNYDTFVDIIEKWSSKDE